jgi:hypothetical protein
MRILVAIKRVVDYAVPVRVKADKVRSSFRSCVLALMQQTFHCSKGQPPPQYMLAYTQGACPAMCYHRVGWSQCSTSSQ